MSAFTAIDLSTLPPPEVVETLDYETIYERLRGRYAAIAVSRGVGVADFVEGDPAVIVMEAAAYEILLERQQRNDDARGLMLAYASGGNLDQIAANVGVYRRVLVPADSGTFPPVPAVLEDDPSLRRRAQLAPEAWTNAGTEASYIFHALEVDGVADATAISPAPGDVTVTIAGPDGMTSQALIDAVSTYLAHEDRRQLTDHLTIQGANIIASPVAATLILFPGPAAGPILAEARTQLDTYLASTARIGRDITRSGLFAALHVAGVQNVDLAAPAADLVVGETEIAAIGVISLTEGARDV